MHTHLVLNPGPVVCESITLSACPQLLLEYFLSPLQLSCLNTAIILLFQTGPFRLKSPPVSTFHQQLWLIAEIITDNRGGMLFE